METRQVQSVWVCLTESSCSYILSNTPKQSFPSFSNHTSPRSKAMFSQIHFVQKALVLMFLLNPTNAFSGTKALKNPFSKSFERRKKSYKALRIAQRQKRKWTFTIPSSKFKNQVHSSKKSQPKNSQGPRIQWFRRGSRYCYQLSHSIRCTTTFLSIAFFFKIAKKSPKKQKAGWYFLAAETAWKKSLYLKRKQTESYAHSIRHWRQCCYRKSARYRRIYPKLDLLWFKLAQKYEKKGYFMKAAKWYTLYYLHDRILKGTKLSKSLNRNQTNSVISSIRKQLRKKKALSKAVLLYRKLGNSKLSQLLLMEARQ